MGASTPGERCLSRRNEVKAELTLIHFQRQVAKTRRREGFNHGCCWLSLNGSERVIAARAELARERAAAAMRQTIAAEVEALILGIQPIKQVQERLWQPT